MAIDDKRIYDKPLYVPGGTGMPAINEMEILVDHFDLPTPYRYSLSPTGIEISIRYEADTFGELIDEDVEVAFSIDPAFTTAPVGWVKCYKIDSGYEYNYLIYNLAVTTSGFTFTIQDVSGVTITDFTGIVVEYYFAEKNV
jgi:hypothetical protein